MKSEHSIAAVEATRPFSLYHGQKRSRQTRHGSTGLGKPATKRSGLDQVGNANGARQGFVASHPHTSTDVYVRTTRERRPEPRGCIQLRRCDSLLAGLFTVLNHIVLRCHSVLGNSNVSVSPPSRLTCRFLPCGEQPVLPQTLLDHLRHD